MTIKNGSVFAGTIARESEDEIHIELGQGRIRIPKRDIVSRVDEEVEKSVKPNAAREKERDDSRRFEELLRLRQRNRSNPGQPGDVATGMRGAARAIGLKNIPVPEGTPEQASERFLALLLEGHVEDAVGQWVNPEKALATYFPSESHALTSYSRAETVRLFHRFLTVQLSDRDLLTRLRACAPEVLTVRDIAGRSLVEVKLAQQAEDEPPSTLMMLEDNRIYDFGGVLPALRRTCREISATLKHEQSGVAGLLATMETTIAAKLASEAQQVADSDDRIPLSDTSSGTPMVRRESGYRLTIPPGWKVSDSDRPEFADLLLSDADGKAYVMVVQEDFATQLRDLERATRFNLTSADQRAEIGSRRVVEFGEYRGLRFDATATIRGCGLVYRYLLVTTESRSYQVIAWTSQVEDALHRLRVEQCLDGFRPIKNRVVALEDAMAPLGPSKSNTPASGGEGTSPATNPGGSPAPK